MRASPFRLMLVSALALGLAACTEPTPKPTATPTPAPQESTAGPSPTAGPVEPEPSTGTVAPGKASLAVYYLGNDKGRPVLFREFHTLPVTADSGPARVTAAVTEMLDGRTAHDPDYSSGWPASARVRGAEVSGDTVTVDLAGSAVNADDPVGSAQAVQQLIWTATAASGASSVVVKLDGKAVKKLWNQVDVSKPLRRGPAADVLAAVWVIDPQHGSTVGRTFTVHLAGIVFEAQARLKITKGSTVVVDQHVLLSGGAPAQGTLKLTFTLPPGTYEVSAFEISAKDSSIQHVDNHTFTVA